MRVLQSKLLVPILLLVNSQLFSFETRDVAKYVRPFVPNGRVIPGPMMPWGSVNPGPDTRNGIISGYNPNEQINGFSQLHVSGTGGRGEYGNFMVSSQIGLTVDSSGHSSPKANEIISCGYYSVDLTRYAIKTEVTPTHHAAIYRFTFPASNDAHLYMDLGANIPGDYQKKDNTNIEKATAGQVNLTPSSNKMTGWVSLIGGGVGIPYKIHFCAKFSKAASAFGTNRNKTISPGTTENSVANLADRIGGYYKYSTQANEQIIMKIAVSFKSVENAEMLLDKEIPSFNFDSIKTVCTAAWNKELSRILIDGASEDQLKMFYTALYHSMIMPHDRTLDNPKFDTGEPYFDDHYAIWDTWRTLWPLITLIKPSQTARLVRSFVDRFKHNAVIRDVFCKGGETDYMQGGDNVTNIMADAYVKKVEGVDWEVAYQAMERLADGERSADYIRNNRGITSVSLTGGPSSKSLEFSYNDFCVSQVARGLGKTAKADMYLNRSMQWERTFNAEHTIDGYKGFIGGLNSDNTWFAGSFYEGGNWDYSYFAPHDYARLIALMGGKDVFANRLKWAIDNDKINFANEPSFMTVRSFNYALRPDLTSYAVRQVFARGAGRGYTLQGYPGDEDAGAMSSWYVFSSLGIFPNSGQDVYLINGPLFTKATIQLENGKNIVINGTNASATNMYVQSATLNGAPLNRCWFKHNEIAQGAEFSFTMGANPSSWAFDGTPPPSINSTGAPAPISDVKPQSGPFPSGTPWSIPGLIQAENYDYGAENGYHTVGPRFSDNDFYRYDGIPIGSTNLTGWQATMYGGWWTRYTVDIKATGKYDIIINLSIMRDPTKFTLTFENSTKTDTITIASPNLTLGKQQYIIKGIQLTQGVTKMKFSCIGLPLSIDNFVFKPLFVVANQLNYAQNSRTVNSCNVITSGSRSKMVMVEFQAPEPGNYTISLISPAGRICKSVKNYVGQRGSMKVPLMLNTLSRTAGGTYILNLSNGRFTMSKKVQLF